MRRHSQRVRANVKTMTDVNKVNKVYGILDIFHPSINKGETPEVRSDDPCFNGDIEEFFRWCRIHNADNQWYEIAPYDTKANPSLELRKA